MLHLSPRLCNRSTMPPREKTERRAARRFPITLEVRYWIFDKKEAFSGRGETLNISSSGILFTTEQHTLHGKYLELSVTWPALLNKRTPLQLILKGELVRSEAGRAAIQIRKYEFRTARQ